jgi:hypothetical protein
MKTKPIKTYGIQQRQCQEESLQPCLHILKTKILNKQPNAIFQTPRKEQDKPKRRRRRKIIKIRAKINEIETYIYI